MLSLCGFHCNCRRLCTNSSVAVPKIGWIERGVGYAKRYVYEWYDDPMERKVGKEG